MKKRHWIYIIIGAFFYSVIALGIPQINFAIFFFRAIDILTWGLMGDFLMSLNVENPIIAGLFIILILNFIVAGFLGYGIVKYQTPKQK